jgi:hypothetical protein
MTSNLQPVFWANSACSESKVESSWLYEARITLASTSGRATTKLQIR